MHMPSTLDTILFDLDGTLIPMDQDVFLHAYFSRIQQRAVQLGLDPAAFMGALAKGTKAMPGVYHVPIVAPKQRFHQTEKPVELLESLLAICPPGGTVLDAFMGSGSTGVAAVKTGRSFIGMELSDQYFNTATKRIQEAEDELLNDF